MPIIVATRREFIAALDQYVICDLCGFDVSAVVKMYYIPSINQVYCEDCFDLWAQNAILYKKADGKVIQQNIDSLTQKFKDLGCWEDSEIV